MNRKLILLHFTIFLLSFPSLFAKGLDIPAGILSWWRCLLAACIAFAILFITKKYKLPSKSLKWVIITGSLMGLHWWTYFASIQYSSVAIGILALFTHPILTVLIEPFFSKTKISKKQLIGAFGIIVGVFILIPEFTLSNSTTKGILIGITSAIFFSIRNILTRKHLSHIPAFTTMGYHALFACLVLTIPLLTQVENFSIPTSSEFMYLVILAVFFTLGSHGLLVYALKHFTASKVGILGSLQVLYGTLFAFILFKEAPNMQFFIGAAIILGVAIYEMWPVGKKEIR